VCGKEVYDGQDGVTDKALDRFDRVSTDYEKVICNTCRIEKNRILYERKQKRRERRE